MVPQQQIPTDPAADSQLTQGHDACRNDDALTTLNSERGLVAIARGDLRFFIEADESPDAYKWFLSRTGTVMKEEARTSIILFQGSESDASGRNPSYVLKIYRYPPSARIRTFARIPVAEREYRGLKQCRMFDIPAAHPAGYGIERTAGGMVRSCFVLTRFEEAAIDFRAWMRQNVREELGQTGRIVHILRRLGHFFHQLHSNRFFLMKPSAKNILLNNAHGPCPEPMFIDLGYSRFLTQSVSARYGQRSDLGQLFGSLLRQYPRTVMDPFLETYLPDPLGHVPVRLRRLIVRAARVHNNETALSRVSHGIHRALKGRKRK